MDITRNILKEIIKKNNEEKPKLKVNVEIAMEYAKWLSYVPDFQKENIARILSIKTSELTDIEIKQLERFKEQQHLAPIFYRYITNECKNEDILPVYNYMKNHSIEKIMTSKLTEEELKQANIMISEVVTCNHLELNSLVRSWQEFNAYQALTMVHAYCFHILKKISIERSSRKLDEDIRMAVNSNNAYTQDAFGKRQRLTK